MSLIPDGEYTATVVEIEETLVTLELSSEEGDEGELYKLVVGEEELPSPARHVDAVLHVTTRNDELVDVAYDPEETTTRTEETRDRFERLSRRPPNADEDNTS